MLATIFNGTSDYVSLADNAALTLANTGATKPGWVLSAIAKVTAESATHDQLQCLFGWGTYGAANSLFVWYAESNHATAGIRSKIYVYGKTANGTAFDRTSVSTLTLGTYYQIGLYLNDGGTSLALTINGTLEGAGSFSSNDSIDAGASFYIGCRGGTTNWWNGAICCAAKWDRALAYTTEMARVGAFTHPCAFPSGLAWCLEMGDNLSEIIVPLTAGGSTGTTDGPTVTLPVEAPLNRYLTSAWPCSDLLDATSWLWDHHSLNNGKVEGTCLSVSDEYISFDGASYVEHDHQACPTLYQGDTFWFSADVYFTSIAADATIMGSWTASGSKLSRVLYYDQSEGKITAGVSTDGSTPVTVAVTATIEAATWYRVQFWCDGVNLGVRVNDTEATTAFSSSIAYDDATPFRLGHSVDCGYLTGRMKNVLFWTDDTTTPRYWRNVVAAGWWPTLDEPTDLDLVILCGQSNANGYATLTPLVNPDEDSYRRPVPWYRGGRVENQGTELFTGWGPTCAGGVDALHSGPELGIADILGAGWGILRYGVGSTALDTAYDVGAGSWYPGDGVHTELVSQVAAALAQLADVGITGHPRVIAFVIGETDATDFYLSGSHTSYAANAVTLIADLRSRWGNLPVLFVQNAETQNDPPGNLAYIDTVRAQQALLPSLISDCQVLDPSDWANFEADGVHYDAYTQLRLGREIGRKVKEMSLASMEDRFDDLDAAVADVPTTSEMTAAFTEIKGATWDTNDTLEAIRDRGDAAWTTIAASAIRTAVGLATANLDTQLSGISTYVDCLPTSWVTVPTASAISTQVASDLASAHGSGAWGSEAAGTGARTVAITVNDGTNPLENAKVRLTLGAESYVALTNSSGVATLYVDDGTWTVTITKTLHTFTATTIVVDGNETQTYSMTASTIPESDVDRVTGYWYCYDEDGAAESGVAVQLRIKSLSGYGVLSDAKVRSETSDANGLVSFTNLVPGATYQVRRGDDWSWTDVTVSASATSPYAMPDVLGED